jgi:integrase
VIGAHKPLIPKGGNRERWSEREDSNLRPNRPLMSAHVHRRRVNSGPSSIFSHFRTPPNIAEHPRTSNSYYTRITHGRRFHFANQANKFGPLWASHMLAGGADLAYVSAQLGHANPSITLRIYSHWVPGTRRVTTSILDTKPASTPEINPLPSYNA